MCALIKEVAYVGGYSYYFLQSIDSLKIGKIKEELAMARLLVDKAYEVLWSYY